VRSTRKALALLALALALGQASLGQHTGRHDSFAPGEVLTYKAYYNLSFLWVDAGRVTFAVREVDEQGAKLLNLVASGTSVPKYDWVYKVRDYFSSLARPSDLAPVRFVRQTSEGDYAVNNSYRFDQQRKLIYSSIQRGEEPRFEDTLSFRGQVFDLLTAPYWSRGLDFGAMDVGQRVNFQLLVDNEIHTMQIRFLGKEQVELPEDERGRSFRCLKFAATMVAGSIFKEGAEVLVWVTDDANHIPVLVEAEILVGTVKAVLLEAYNLAHPLDALVR